MRKIHLCDPVPQILLTLGRTMIKTWICLLLSCLTSLAAQRPKRPAPDPEIKRDHVVLRLLNLREVEGDGSAWKPFESKPCATCTGKKKLPCRACTGGQHRHAKKCSECKAKGKVKCPPCLGKGKSRDPLLAMPCPRCESRSLLVCRVCKGIGKISVDGSLSNCLACKRKGGHKCPLCLGKKMVRLPTAGAKSLETATKKQLDALLAKMKGLEKEAAQLVYAFRRRAKELPKEEAGILHLHKTFMMRMAKVIPTYENEVKQMPRVAKALHGFDGAKLFSLGGALYAGKTVPLEVRSSLKSAGRALQYLELATKRCTAVAAKRSGG